MGLDMYLTGRRYLSEHFQKGDGKISKDIQSMFPELSDQAGRWGDDDPVIKEIQADIGYWRKANAVHAWFVKNVQDGKDDCDNYYVSRDQLKALREVCVRVSQFQALATDLLPPQDGFFFGSTDCNEYYYRDIENTIKIIDRALALPNSWEFEYHASW